MWNKQKYRNGPLDSATELEFDRLVRDLRMIGEAIRVPPGLRHSIHEIVSPDPVGATTPGKRRSSGRSRFLKSAIALAAVVPFVVFGSLVGGRARVLPGIPTSAVARAWAMFHGDLYAPTCPVTTTQYRVQGTGSAVGLYFLDLNVENVGKAIPNFVLSVNSRGSWTVKAVSAGVQPDEASPAAPVSPRLLSVEGNVHIWSLGVVPACAVLRFHLVTNPTLSSGTSDEMTAYANVTRDGKPDPRTVVYGGADALTSGTSP